MNLQSITSHLMNKFPETPQSAVILGSGLGKFIDNMKGTLSISYTDIPKHPRTTVSGHTGEWVFGYINNKPIICANGRFHYYEGFSMEEVTLPVSIVHSLGCQSLIITNAAGSLKKEWKIGDLMLITGYLDYTFRGNSGSPVVIPIYKDTKEQKKIQKIASNADILLREGIYSWTLGPSYETSAEIQDIILLGGNAVGMSTVPEMIKARELGLDVVGISCLTNYGAGLKGTILSHKDILKTSNQTRKILSKLLFNII